MSWCERTEPRGDQVQEALILMDVTCLEIRRPGPSAPRGDQCWVCWHCCRPVSKSPDLYFPVVSHLYRGCCNLPTAGSFSPHRAAFHPLECSPRMLELLIKSWSVGSVLCQAATPRKWSHVAAEAARHILAPSLVRAHQSQSQATLCFISSALNAVGSPSCPGFGSTAGKMMWALADFLIVALGWLDPKMGETMSKCCLWPG